ncbi:hypothetical protein TIFTF001_041645 [Ficus carica]|uniref:Uncharacterized protein n=1 Tax=Ficus carica TaxID=3494 RepID=A0AA87ZEZ5_FICCA|nr:hypothetical protein TIFTF001_041645 [Ficus carica]
MSRHVFFRQRFSNRFAPPVRVGP